MKDTYTFINPSGNLESIDLKTGLSDVASAIPVIARYQYSYRLGQGICNLIREGMTFKAIAAMEQMPSTSIIYRWRQIYPDFKENCDQAMKDRSMHYHDRILEEVDELDDTTKDDVPAKRLKIDTLKWAADRADPVAKKAAEGGSGDVTIVVNTGITRDNVIEVTDGQSKIIQPPEVDSGESSD